MKGRKIQRKRRGGEKKNKGKDNCTKETPIEMSGV